MTMVLVASPIKPIFYPNTVHCNLLVPEKNNPHCLCEEKYDATMLFRNLSFYYLNPRRWSRYVRTLVLVKFDIYFMMFSLSSTLYTV